MARERSTQSAGLYNSTEGAQNPCSTSSESVPATASLEEALAAVGAEVAAESTPTDQSFSYQTRLTVQFRAQKKEVLWGVCSKATSSGGSKPVDALPKRNVMRRKPA